MLYLSAKMQATAAKVVLHLVPKAMQQLIKTSLFVVALPKVPRKVQLWFPPLHCFANRSAANYANVNEPLGGCAHST